MSKIWRVLLALLPGLFIGFMMAVTIEPVGDALAIALHCPGAVSTSKDETSGGTQRMTATSPQTTGTKIVAIACQMPDGSEKLIGNDTLAITKIADGAAAGALIEIVLIALWWVQSKIRRISGNAA
ncbi:MAG TPA: hypothetical protein VHL11_13905 [Phototrophicaceae bacterium]|jgi:hypothetical protein|nr:hypothetical protein [Phototrophicaceae bacterium]